MSTPRCFRCGRVGIVDGLDPDAVWCVACGSTYPPYSPPRGNAVLPPNNRVRVGSPGENSRSARTIMEILRKHGPMTRRQLARALGISTDALPSYIAAAGRYCPIWEERGKYGLLDRKTLEQTSEGGKRWSRARRRRRSRETS